ncbi:MAG: M3 family oligoendopeptidase [Firmicutes bacterium]|nr:M3 family oligoendopeptidase [Bacillota bacterium]
MAKTITLLYFDGCPNWKEAEALVKQQMRPGDKLEYVRVQSGEEAQQKRFLGSPTVRVDGTDVEPGADSRTDFGLKCRIYLYDGSYHGAPKPEWIARALGRAEAGAAEQLPAAAQPPTTQPGADGQPGRAAHPGSAAPAGLDPADWSTVQPRFDALQARNLTPDNVGEWLQEWSDLRAILEDAIFASYRAVTENTADPEIEARYLHFMQDIQPKITVAEQGLRRKLLALKNYQPPANIREFYRRQQNQAALFREENVPLQAELAGMENEYNKIVGAMSVTLDGQEMTLQQANQRLYSPERAVREEAWRSVQVRWLQDRSALDDLYLQMLKVRRQMARNAGLPDFRAYRWRELSRFCYTPEDCLRFHEAIEQEVVPLARKYAAWRQRLLGVERLRPWDTEADPLGRPALHPFSQVEELIEGVQRIFNHLDPELGAYFARMRNGNLDLASRPHKAPGGYCGGFHLTRTPYIFANCVGIQDDVNTLLHESGHAFHFIESCRQPLIWNRMGAEAVNFEFAEVASMGMELLGAAYLERSRGGFYSEQDARRARAEHLLGVITFLPYMAVVDAFQHWVYTQAPEDVTAADLDRQWGALWDRFMSWTDWSGLEDEKVSGWHRKGHIFETPFYYVEYGLAQLGALQVWRNSLHDAAGAVAAYRRALALGNTRPLPELFEAAGARLAFDRPTIGGLMRLVDGELQKLL